MITDRSNQVSIAQAITSTAVSTHSVDQIVPRSLGGGDPVVACISVVTTFQGVGASLTLQVIGSDTADLASPTVLSEGGPIPVGTLVAGTLIDAPPVPRNAAAKRFIGLNYVVTSGPFTAGAVDAWVIRGERYRG